MQKAFGPALVWIGGIVTGVCVGASALVAQQPSRLDVPLAADFRVADARLWMPCFLGTALEQVARQSWVLVGLQNEPGCSAGERTKSRSYYLRDAGDEAFDLSGATAREVFAQLLAIAPAYRGVEFDGIFIVRPARVWDDPGDILNRPLPPFSVKDAGVKDVVRVILQSATPSLYPAIPAAAIQYVWRPGQRIPRHWIENGLLPAPDPRPLAPIERPITMTFAGGTLLQALNALAVQQQLNWQIGYIQTPGQLRAQVILSDVALWPSGGLTSALTVPLARLH